jgi:hypothetical protein
MDQTDAAIRRLARLLLDARPAQYCESCLALKAGISATRAHEVLARALRIVKLASGAGTCASCGRPKTVFSLPE